MNRVGQKILIVCDSSKSLIDFRGKLIEQLVQNHQVSVFTPQITHQSIREKLSQLNVDVYENKLDGSNVSVFADLKFIGQLYKLIKKVRPDVFFPYTFKPVIYGTLLAKLCKVKKITPMLTGLGYNFTQEGKTGLLSYITRRLLKFSLGKNRRLKIIFQNKDDYQTLLDHKILTTKHKVAIVNGSGVDLEHYEYTMPDASNISFLMIARLINAKGINEYYEAANNIQSQYPDIQFRLIGAYGPNVDAISDELYNKIKSGKTITYLGEVHDVRPYINDASVVVLPSYYGEGVPRCLLESMAMGRAIITCDSVGCRETIETAAEPNGFLIPAKNVNELVSKMEFYLNNRDTVRSYGINGLAYARKKFDVNLVNTEMLKIMQLN
ncbi:MAG: glycosyltransferase family 4 protein [Mucilaginibacter sp.]|uniref:glycosyltransferase family 4 protein n=1 Tax=Mucilaginibacter sp. TaxID=1882438 RepID=UPI0031A2264F